MFRSQALILSTQVSPARPPFLTCSTEWVKKLWLPNNTQLRLWKFARPQITIHLAIMMGHITVCIHPVLHAPPTTPSATAAVPPRPWNNCLSCFSSYFPHAVREREREKVRRKSELWERLLDAPMGPTKSLQFHQQDVSVVTDTSIDA